MAQIKNQSCPSGLQLDAIPPDLVGPPDGFWLSFEESCGMKDRTHLRYNWDLFHMETGV
jgi:hypothetical protein